MAKTGPMWRIDSSGIHQRGLFATREIPKDAWILEYVGERVSKEESNRRALEWEAKARKSGEGLVYIFELNDEVDIDGHNEDNPARLINHSCDPNCEAVVWEDTIWIVSKRRIRQDEELTFDYGYDVSHFLDHPCRCGAANCVGYIVRRDQWPKLREILKRMEAQKQRGEQPSRWAKSRKGRKLQED